MTGPICLDNYIRKKETCYIRYLKRYAYIILHSPYAVNYFCKPFAYPDAIAQTFCQIQILSGT